MLYDLIIIGTGPAGMTAAIYAARRKIKFLLLGLDIGGQMNWSSEVDNYPGLPDFTGIEIVQKFNKHIKDYNVSPKLEEVLDIQKKDKTLLIKTKQNTYETKSIIISSGKKPRKLGVPGEDNFLGRGVTYCATCDAPFYKEKIVAVIGAGNSGLEASLFLAKYAKKVFLIDVGVKLRGEPYLKDKVLANKKIIPVLGAKITEILGDKSVKGIKYIKDNQQKIQELEGIFIEVGLIAKADFAKIVRKNKWGEIMIYRSTKTPEENMTSIPGIFAAGDVTDIPAKQIVVAAGEGAKAALAAFDYINRLK